jgi:flagellar motor switch/type III secretory pathway protein FliN
MDNDAQNSAEIQQPGQTDEPPSQTDVETGKSIDDSVIAATAVEDSVESDRASEKSDAATGTDQSCDPARLNRILAMKVPVIVKIAQRKISFSDVLKFHIGTVIQFDKDPYQYIDLMVNNSKIGAGQPVKVAENFGLKVMQIAPVADTIRSLGTPG